MTRPLSGSRAELVDERHLIAGHGEGSAEACTGDHMGEQSQLHPLARRSQGCAAPFTGQTEPITYFGIAFVEWFNGHLKTAQCRYSGRQWVDPDTREERNELRTH